MTEHLLADFDEPLGSVESLVPSFEAEGVEMAKRVNLDAMIPRADFGEVQTVSKQERIGSFGLVLCQR